VPELIACQFRRLRIWWTEISQPAPASLAKGLEYDHVIVIEPAGIIGAEPRGLNRLYVALTRAVSRLDVLHSAELPPELAA
jgi:DNA helicase IV